MPYTIFLSGGRSGEREAARRWLVRRAFGVAQTATRAAARDRAAVAAHARAAVGDCDAILAFASGRPTRDRDAELGLAVGLGRRILLVGDPDHPLHHHPAVERHPNWGSARAALAGLDADAAGPRLAPGLVPDEDDLAVRFWAEFAARALPLAPHLDQYVPGFAAGVSGMHRLRSAVYRGVRLAWIAAGRPRGVGGDGDLGDEAGRYTDYLAASEWFTGRLRLAEIDRTRAALDSERDGILLDRRTTVC